MSASRRGRATNAAAIELLALPRDVDAERALLASICLNNATLVDALRFGIEPSDFGVSLHQRIYHEALKLAARGELIELVTLHGAMRDAGLLESEVDRVALMKLCDGQQKSANVAAYAARVKECSRRRAIMRLGDALVHAASNGTAPEDLDEQIADLVKSAERTGSTLPAEDAADVMDRPIPKTPTAIEGLVAEGDVILVSGAGGIGKSLIAVHAGLALASGRKLFGHYSITRPYKVALLDLESRPWEMDQRLHRLAAGMTLGTASLRGQVQIIRRRIRLDEPANVRALMASIRAWGTEFLIVDSFRRAFRGDANKAEVVSELFIGALDRIRLETGCGCILTDHTRKRTGEADLDAPDQMLHGSVDKRNMSDGHFGIEDRQGRLAFIPTKTRHSRKPQPVLLEMKGLGPEDDEDGPVTIKCVGNLDAASDRVQDAIVSLLTETYPAGLFRGEIIGRAGYGERSVDDALSILRHKERVTRKMEGKQAYYTLRPQRPQTTATAPGAA